MRHLNVVNVTGRISDLRAEGHRVECVREGKRFVYRLVAEGQMSLPVAS
jgi:hypothetical protein